MPTDTFPLCSEAILAWVDKSVWVENVQPTSGDSSANEFCAICQDTIIAGEHIALFSCKHLFHYTCARRWMWTCIGGIKPVKCPVCNYVVLRATFQQWHRNHSRASMLPASADLIYAETSLRPVYAAGERNFSPRPRASCMHWVQRVVLSWCG